MWLKYFRVRSFWAVLAIFICGLNFANRSYAIGAYADFALSERIQNFDVTVVVNEDSSIIVREELKIFSTGDKIKRGIIRAIPVRYKSDNGRTVSVGLDVLSTCVDGKELPWKEYDKGRGRSIRIGDVNKALSYGSHTLSLTYKTTKQIGFYDDYDELYWNVTGNDWDIPIENASFSLSLPGEVNIQNAEWFVGSYGSTENTGAMLDDTGKIRLTRILYPGEGLTVVYTWAKGIIPEPYAALNEKLLDFFYGYSDTICRLLLSVGMFSTLCLLLAGYVIVSKYKQRPTVIPLFHVPEGLSPSLVRYVMMGMTDTRSLSAELINLAIGGALKILGNKYDGYRLVKGVSEPTSDLGKRLVKELFFRGDTIEITKKASDIIRSSLNIVRSDILPWQSDLFEDKRTVIRAAYFLLLIFSVISAVILMVTDSMIRETWVTSVLLAFISACSLLNISRGRCSRGRGIIKTFMSETGPLLPILVFTAFVGYADGNPVYCFIGISLALIGVPLKSLLLIWTEEGLRVRSRAEGLEMFILMAEKDRFNMLNAPDDSPALFEELLPYAVALGCVENWTRRFEKKLIACEYNPEWCGAYLKEGAIRRTAREAAFAGIAENFTENFSANLASSSTPPGSRSGFSGARSGGGGGFSGGGGGGGGGRGW